MLMLQSQPNGCRHSQAGASRYGADSDSCELRMKIPLRKVMADPEPSGANRRLARRRIDQGGESQWSARSPHKVVRATVPVSAAQERTMPQRQCTQDRPWLGLVLGADTRKGHECPPQRPALSVAEAKLTHTFPLAGGIIELEVRLVQASLSSIHKPNFTGADRSTCIVVGDEPYRPSSITR